MYARNPEDADCIIFNSHQQIKEALTLKSKYPDKFFIHRLDGIFTLTRKNKSIDNFIYQINRYIADGTIFQSNWSREVSKRLGLKKNEYETVIINCADPAIFFSEDNVEIPPDKWCIIASSWVKNLNKGLNSIFNLEKILLFLLINLP